MTYLPKVVIQLDGSRCQGGNCGCATGAMALAFVTRGASHATGAAVRNLLPGSLASSSCAGTYIQQVAYAIERGWPSADVYVETGTIVPWSTVEARRREGRGIHLGVNYGAVRRYLPSLLGSLVFTGNHFYFGCDVSKYADPLWDSRRLSSTRYAPSPVFRSISSTTMARIAGAFEVDGVPIGTGKAYVGWTRVQTGAPVIPPTTPGDVDMIFGDPVGQDWQPKTTRRPVRNAPIRSGSASTAAIVGYVEVGQTFRSEFELKTPDGNVWRQGKFRGKTGFILRADFVDVTKRGDPVDVYFQDYADRKTP